LFPGGKASSTAELLLSEKNGPINIIAFPGKIKLPAFRPEPEDGYEIVRMNRR
jgi:hypothetical protein